MSQCKFLKGVGRLETVAAHALQLQGGVKQKGLETVNDLPEHPITMLVGSLPVIRLQSAGITRKVKGAARYLVSAYVLDGFRECFQSFPLHFVGP